MKAFKNKSLSNIASWMGEIFVKNDRPILIKHLDLSQLLLDAFESEKTQQETILLASVVFVSRILARTAESKVFIPPNPWLMSLLGLLKEIYINNVEINVKFEIEAVLKSIKVNLNDVKNDYSLAVSDIKKNYGENILKNLPSKRQIVDSNDNQCFLFLKY